jgi:hypothetical protein
MNIRQAQALARFSEVSQEIEVALQQPDWVRLTDLEIISAAEACNLWGSDYANDVLDFAALISKKLKEKNA